MYTQTLHTVVVDTPGRGLHDITPVVSRAISTSPITEGLATLFIRHTSASLLIQENADPDVLGDLERFMARLVPDGHADYKHRSEGPDDMPAHIRAALTAVQLAIPLSDSRLLLGNWQAIYLWEHRTQPCQREVIIHVAGQLPHTGD